MTHPARLPVRRPAFTLVEMLVVIGIITVIAGLLGVVVSKARGTASKFQLAAQLQTIAVGLDAYKTDFQAYPITTVADGVTGNADDEINADGFRGARMLCKALMGQCPQGALTGATATTGTFDPARPNQDGSDGFGFRVPGRSGVFAIDQGNPAPTATRTMIAGKVYGPYLNIDKFKVVDITTADSYVVNTKTYQQGDFVKGNIYTDRAVLLDANGSPILYFPCLNPQAPASAASTSFAYVQVGHVTTVPPNDYDPTSAYETGSATLYPGTAMYRSTDNSFWINAPLFRKCLGDINLNNSTGTDLATDGDGVVNASFNEQPAVIGKYILWTAGPDKIFGPNLQGNVNAVHVAIKRGYDDVTNFQGE